MGKRNRERVPKPVEKTDVEKPERLFYCLDGCDRGVWCFCQPWCSRQTKPKPKPIKATEL